MFIPGAFFARSGIGCTGEIKIYGATVVATPGCWDVLLRREQVVQKLWKAHLECGLVVASRFFASVLFVLFFSHPLFAISLEELDPNRESLGVFGR